MSEFSQNQAEQLTPDRRRIGKSEHGLTARAYNQVRAYIRKTPKNQPRAYFRGRAYIRGNTVVEITKPIRCQKNTHPAVF